MNALWNAGNPVFHRGSGGSDAESDDVKHLQWLKTACSGRAKVAAGSSADDIGCEAPRRNAHDFPAVASSLGNLLDRDAPANQGLD
jgi:hypothetical protein